MNEYPSLSRDFRICTVHEDERRDCTSYVFDESTMECKYAERVEFIEFPNTKKIYQGDKCCLTICKYGMDELWEK
jgi:hypothetical protein